MVTQNSAQARAGVRLRGKVLQRKELRARVGSRRTGWAGRWTKKRDRTGPITGRSTLHGGTTGYLFVEKQLSLIMSLKSLGGVWRKAIGRRSRRSVIRR